MPLIAYYRVSTIEQGKSGLGLEAQREAVRRYAELAGETIRAEFTEVLSSGKERPIFDEALAMCEQYGDTLAVAKLDRLARDLHTITSLQKTKVDFLSVDMPGATKFMIHILGAVAEHERDMISARTKAALARAKAKGTRLGAPDPMAAIEAVTLARSTVAEEFRAQLRDRVQEMRRAGHTLQQIADAFNRELIAPPSGSGQWCPKKVSNVLKRPNGLNLGDVANDAGDDHERLPLFAASGHMR